VHLILQINLFSAEGELAFILTHQQFPVRLYFAMTINKSQGQSLQTVGVDLQTAVFSHGQLYVALSRVTDVCRLTILNRPGRGRHVQNVVYSEVLELLQ
jgi:ATP-dependent DNA helicase PIF1